MPVSELQSSLTCHVTQMPDRVWRVAVCLCALAHPSRPGPVPPTQDPWTHEMGVDDTPNIFENSTSTSNSDNTPRGVYTAVWSVGDGGGEVKVERGTRNVKGAVAWGYLEDKRQVRWTLAYSILNLTVEDTIVVARARAYAISARN